MRVATEGRCASACFKHVAQLQARPCGELVT